MDLEQERQVTNEVARFSAKVSELVACRVCQARTGEPCDAPAPHPTRTIDGLCLYAIANAVSGGPDGT